MQAPGTKQITVKSLRDIVAFQCLWAVGEFPSILFKFIFPVGSGCVKVNETRGMGHESYDSRIARAQAEAPGGLPTRFMPISKDRPNNSPIYAQCGPVRR
jgi:hypothetical protein